MNFCRSVGSEVLMNFNLLSVAHKFVGFMGHYDKFSVGYVKNRRSVPWFDVLVHVIPAIINTGFMVCHLGISLIVCFGFKFFGTASFTKSFLSCLVSPSDNFFFILTITLVLLEQKT